MKLIDGNIQALSITEYILKRKEKFIEILQKGDNDFLFALMMDYFDAQPGYNITLAQKQKARDNDEK